MWSQTSGVMLLIMIGVEVIRYDPIQVRLINPAFAFKKKKETKLKG